MIENQIVHLNGALLRLGDAKISVLDRGFIYGDGAYEVVPVYSRKPFRMQHHLNRLQRTLDAIRLPNPHDDTAWQRLIGEVVERAGFDDQAVYLQVTRGVAKRDHSFPEGVPPTVFIMTNPLPSPTREQVERGVAVVTADDNRWDRCDLKTTSLLPNVLMRQLATDAGAAETVMFRDGWLTEASASNVLIVNDGTNVGPPRDQQILPGITYDATVEFAREADLPVEIRPVSRAEALEADEMWLSSSTKEVIAVTTVDGRPFAGGAPGPMFRRIYDIFQAHKPKR